MFSYFAIFDAQNVNDVHCKFFDSELNAASWLVSQLTEFIEAAEFDDLKYIIDEMVDAISARDYGEVAQIWITRNYEMHTTHEPDMLMNLPVCGQGKINWNTKLLGIEDIDLTGHRPYWIQS